MSTMETSKHEEITLYSKKRTGKLASINFAAGKVEFHHYYEVPESELLWDSLY